jgi:hypothetical protein
MFEQQPINIAIKYMMQFLIRSNIHNSRMYIETLFFTIKQQHVCKEHSLLYNFIGFNTESATKKDAFLAKSAEPIAPRPPVATVVVLPGGPNGVVPCAPPAG